MRINPIHTPLQLIVKFLTLVAVHRFPNVISGCFNTQIETMLLQSGPCVNHIFMVCWFWLSLYPLLHLDLGGIGPRETVDSKLFLQCRGE